MVGKVKQRQKMCRSCDKDQQGRTRCNKVETKTKQNKNNNNTHTSASFVSVEESERRLNKIELGRTSGKILDNMSHNLEQVEQIEVSLNKPKQMKTQEKKLTQGKTN